MGMYLMGTYLMGVYLMFVHLMGVYLMGVYLMGVHLIGIIGLNSEAWVRRLVKHTVQTEGRVLRLVERYEDGATISRKV